MEVPRPTQESKDAFRALVPAAPTVTVRAMFANLAAFVNGNMFMALYGDQVAFKMDAAALERAMTRADAETFGPAGRTMREYVAFPLAAAGLDEWVEASLGYVATLPPKAPRAPR
ncbi:TfoX/Sxy family protein [Demequina sp.]|uniref:TfoX/Sxy family protein n=1 Tax=Demequina sp. TaxID=2050685 RepID=UPI0025E6134F|nr:TfoX/Sxy family protein [Demequina sp.]